MTKMLLLMVSICLALPVAFASLGVDVSIPTSVSDFQCMKGKGITYAIVRCFRSNGQPDPDCQSTVNNANSAGMSRVDIYMFPCPKCSATGAQQVQATVNNIKAGTYTALWFDIEGPQYWGSTSSNVAFFSSMANEASSLGLTTGVYTSASQWQPIMGSSTVGSSQPLWYAHYDGKPSFSDFTPFNGWTTPTMKQYAGDVTVCGIDLDSDYAGSSYSSGNSASSAASNSGKAAAQSQSSAATTTSAAQSSGGQTGGQSATGNAGSGNSGNSNSGNSGNSSGNSGNTGNSSGGVALVEEQL